MLKKYIYIYILAITSSLAIAATSVCSEIYSVKKNFLVHAQWHSQNWMRCLSPQWCLQAFTSCLLQAQKHVCADGVCLWEPLPTLPQPALAPTTSKVKLCMRTHLTFPVSSLSCTVWTTARKKREDSVEGSTTGVYWHPARDNLTSRESAAAQQRSPWCNRLNTDMGKGEGQSMAPIGNT